MAKLGINTGSTPNDGTGDSLLVGAEKINSNFNELYSALGDGSTLSPVTSIIAGSNVSISSSTGNVTINAAGGGGGGGGAGIDVQDEGVALATTATTLNFVGSGVAASGTGAIKTITISGGGGGGIAGIDTTGTSYFNVVNSSGGVEISSGDLTLSSGGIAASGSSGNLNWGSGNLYFNSGSPEIGWTLGHGIIRSLPSNGQISIRGGNPAENMAQFYAGGAAELYYNNVKKFETSNTGVSIDGEITATGRKAYFTSPESNSPATLQLEIGSHGVGSTVRSSGSLDLSTNGSAFFLHLDDTLAITANGTGNSQYTTLYGQGSEKFRTSPTGITVTGNVEATTATIGAGSSTNRVATPSLLLSHNNPTVVSTAGTTGEFKQIGGQPYYYDGTDWRALFLIDGVESANVADTDWDNTMIRLTFDEATKNDLDNLKDGLAPDYIGSQFDLVGSPVKYGTKSGRFQGGSGEIEWNQDNNGSIRYPFEGAWTIEGWVYVDGSNLPAETNATNAKALFANFHSSTGTGNNWIIGFYYSGSPNTYNFYWQNNNSSDTTISGNTGYVLGQYSSTNFANQWVHIAITRKASDGSIHFFFNGTESPKTNGSQGSIIDSEISDQLSYSFTLGYYDRPASGDTRDFHGNMDDIRVSSIERYTANFPSPSAALPITGTTTTVIQPPNSKIGEIGLGTAPTWTGTPGVAVTQVGSGHYRATFATSYSNSTDYIINTSLMDYQPVTTAVGIGISRTTAYADFFVNRVSDSVGIDTGSLAVDLIKK